MDHNDCPFKGPNGCFLAKVIESVITDRPAQGPAQRREPDPADVDRAKAFLLDRLRDGRAKAGEDLIAQGKAAGIRPGAMFKAKDILGIKAVKDSEGRWWWNPTNPTDDDGVPY